MSEGPTKVMLIIWQHHYRSRKRSTRNLLSTWHLQFSSSKYLAVSEEINEMLRNFRRGQGDVDKGPGSETGRSRTSTERTFSKNMTQYLEA